MASSTTNPFVSTQKATDSLPAVLHPIVLLSISDHITRHVLRKQPGPVVGALLGKQNGRQVTLEQTFDFSVETNQHGEASFRSAWFDDRLNQMRAVHKDRQLDLVGWYAVLDRTGPTAEVFQVHDKILNVCAESAAILLTFHPDDLDEPSVGGKLPLTIYETNYEPDEGGAVRTALRAATKNPAAFADEDEGEDKEMKDASVSPSGGDGGGGGSARIVAKFLEIPFTVESEEAEMISVDFVARGVANAAATDAAAPGGSGSGKDKSSDNKNSSSSSSRDRAVAIESGTKGKRRLVAAAGASSSSTAAAAGAAAASGDPTAADGADLSVADLELISTLTTRANAIRMLHNRLQLLTKYLESLPASELEALGQVPVGGTASTDDDKAAAAAAASAAAAGTAPVSASLPILRSIQALVHRLPLVVPPPVNGAFEEEQKRETNDVQLVSLLLDDLMQSISTVRQVSGKFGVVEQVRMMNTGRGGGGSAGHDYSSMGGLGSPMGSSGLDTTL